MKTGYYWSMRTGYYWSWYCY